MRPLERKPVLLLLLGFLQFVQGRHNFDNLPTILWWDGVGRPEAEIVTCSDDIKCFSTENTTYLHQQKIMVYGFYGNRMFQSGLPMPRLKGDLWALIDDQSPKESHYMYSFDKIVGLFNYSATFKRESDYPFPTNSLKGEAQLMNKAYSMSIEEKNRYRKQRGYAPVAFVHWECHTPSKREGFVKTLMQHVDVDSYGRCLHNKDFPEEQKGLDNLHTFESDDLLMFLARYKFVIAMENAICDDFITDNLWRPLEGGIVPIVKGSPKIKDFLPSEKSAIIVDDFEHAKELADFIKQLDENDDEYEAYREFKHEGISNPTLKSELERRSLADETEHIFMTAFQGFECFLCKKLHEAVNAVKEGGSIPKAEAKIEHMNCPLPVHRYDDDGKHVEDESLHAEAGYYKAHANDRREFYNTINRMMLEAHGDQDDKEEL